MGIKLEGPSRPLSFTTLQQGLKMTCYRILLTFWLGLIFRRAHDLFQIAKNAHSEDKTPQ